ncbi:hypothetical protein Ciccas_013151 [Cichlidogyrus casuarinus]|uniref:Uncharacterized protein n=1 Tax=Cichlidogyrus casuarinus TaxID=1844966 RepID=A0ABD2PM42_9PLAT
MSDDTGSLKKATRRKLFTFNKNKSSDESPLADAVLSSPSTDSSRAYGSRNRPVDVDVSKFELSLESSKHSNNVNGRYLRVFSEGVQKGSFFVTLYVPDSMTVGQCTQELISTHFSRSNETPKGNFHLVEVIGHSVYVTKAKMSRSLADLCSNFEDRIDDSFTPLSARVLDPKQNLLDVFTLLQPPRSLARRLELHRLDENQPVPIIHGIHESKIMVYKHFVEANDSKSVSQLKMMVTPEGYKHLSETGKLCSCGPCRPHLLLIKGCQPGIDKIIQDLSLVFKPNWVMTLGYAKTDDIKLNLPPSANEKMTPIHKTLARFVGHVQKHGLDSVRMEVLDHQTDRMLYLNKNPFTYEAGKQITLQPGDLIRVVTGGLLCYAFLFKNDSHTPEHRLQIPMLSQEMQMTERIIYPRKCSPPPLPKRPNRKLAETTDAYSSSENQLQDVALHPLPSLSTLIRIVGDLMKQTDQSPTVVAALLCQLARAISHRLKSVESANTSTASDDHEELMTDFTSSSSGFVSGLQPQPNSQQQRRANNCLSSRDMCSRLLIAMKKELRRLTLQHKSVSVSSQRR